MAEAGKAFVIEAWKIPPPGPGTIIPWPKSRRINQRLRRAAICKNMRTMESRARHLRRVFSRCFQMFGAEATDCAQKSLDSGSAFIEKLRGAKSLDSAIQIRSDYAKPAWAEFVAYLVRLSDLYCNFSNEVRRQSKKQRPR